MGAGGTAEPRIAMRNKSHSTVRPRSSRLVQSCRLYRIEPQRLEGEDPGRREPHLHRVQAGIFNLVDQRRRTDQRVRLEREG
jgi:hypothetical protein